MSSRLIRQSRAVSMDRRRKAGSPSRFWHNARFRAWLYQAVALVLVIAVAVAMFGNASQALALRGIRTGFGFLASEAGFSISESLWPFSSTNSFFDAFVVGLSNTVWISAVSIVGATILGLLLGLARLSSNWLVARMALAYVEVFRNTPQLIQIVFWYTLMAHFPASRQSWHLSDWVYLGNRGLVLAWPADRAAFLATAAAFLVAVVLAVMLSRRMAKRSSAGFLASARWSGTALVVGVPLLVWLATGASTAMEFPRLRGFNFHGGLALSSEFLALSLGLSLYIAAYIAEIVRAGIQSVGRGQIEAGRAIGLRGFELLRRVVLPQALRVIVPPVTAQYISLVKNSSLGVAVGYPELFNITNSVIVESGHTLECVFIMGAMYLAISLAIAVIMNACNRAITIRGATRS